MTELWPFKIGKIVLIDFVNTIKTIYLLHVLYIGNIDTLLDDADIENRNSTFTFAPGECQRPLSIFQDKDSERSLSDSLPYSFQP